MPFEHQIFPLVVAALAIGLVIYFACWMFRRPKWREELGDTADLDPPRRVGKHPALGAGYRQGPRMAFSPKDEPWDRAEKNVRDHPPRETFHPHPRPTSKRAIQHIVLTPRNLEHVNIIRRRDGKPLLNAAGFRAAVALQSVRSAPIHSGLDWMGYLIAYEVLSLGHQQALMPVSDSIVIAPGEPFNGQGGEFAGAGSTSSFGGFAAALETGYHGVDPNPPGPSDGIGRAATQGMLYGSVAGFAAGIVASEFGEDGNRAPSVADPGPLHDGSLPPPGGASYSGNDPQWSKQDDQPKAAPEPAPEPQAAPEPDKTPDPPASSGGGTDD